MQLLVLVDEIVEAYMEENPEAAALLKESNCVVVLPTPSRIVEPYYSNYR